MEKEAIEEMEEKIEEKDEGKEEGDQEENEAELGDPNAAQTNLAKRPVDKEAKSPGPDLWICVQGIREFTKDFEIVRDLEKLFESEPTGIVSIIKELKRPFFFLEFSDEVQKNKFAAKGSITIRNRELRIRNANVSKNALKKRRTLADLKGFVQKRSENAEKQMGDTNKEFIESLTPEAILAIFKERICAYSDVPYSEQIQKKTAKLVDHLVEIKKLSREKSIPSDYHYLGWLKREDPTCCHIQEFVPADEADQSYYRTKTEFTIGNSVMEKKIKVGFNVSDHKYNFHSIELPSDHEQVKTIPRETVEIARLSENLINELGWPLFQKYDCAQNGFWRFIVVRISKTNNQMIINFVGNKGFFPGETFQISFKEKFISPLIQAAKTSPILKDIEIRSITFQHANTSNDCVPQVTDEEIELFHGSTKTYFERINGCNFEVSNSSFLQINIGQSNKMYRYAREYAGLDENTVLLDICSGIGTIGISVGKNCKKVVGIEMVKSSCANALKNAKDNDMEEKYDVVEGKVEDKIEEVVQKYGAQGLKIVGIVDPPRAGLHPNVVRSLRTCKGLDHLIFICCDIKQSKANIIDLCLPATKKRRGPPFSPIHCTGFDMFPQTPHFESLFVLRRLYEDLNITNN